MAPRPLGEPLPPRRVSPGVLPPERRGGFGVKVVASPSFKRVAARFTSASDIIFGNTVRNLVLRAAVAAQREARLQLKVWVYSAPPPASLATYGPSLDVYLATRRTGLVWRAIHVEAPVREGPTWACTVKVDAESFPAYYYALILNYGGRTINYQARPFWTIMSRIMTLRFRQMGRIALREMKGQLTGDLAGLSSVGNAEPEP